MRLRWQTSSSKLVIICLLALSLPALGSASGTERASLWQPAIGSTFDYQLSVVPTAAQLNDPAEFDVWVFDLFETPQSSIASIQNTTSKVVCYFSAGTYEPGRPDSGQFAASDQGKALDGWPDEKWLKLSSDGVRKIMLQRLDLAQAKGCAGVDPDNVDGYGNDNGLGLTKNDSIDYLHFLASEASNRGLSIGLKNAGDIIGDIIDVMQWSVNEQCSQYNECSTFQPFVDVGKPVFNVEYPKGDAVNSNNVTAAQYQKACNDPQARNFTKIIKNINLDTWIQTCTMTEETNLATSIGTSRFTPSFFIAMGSLMLISMFVA